MSPEPTGVHGLLKQRKLFTHKTILRKNIPIVIMNFQDRNPMEMEKDILLYRQKI